MLNTISHLTSSKVTAVDGEIGKVKAAFFDDQSWTVRYLVVDAGSWLEGRLVLISPYSVKQPLDNLKNIDVALTREQVRGSPDIDTHQPVSRQHERDMMGYYAYPEYWDGGGLWGMGAMPVPLAVAPLAEEMAQRQAQRDRDLRMGDTHLRDSGRVSGYDIAATDGSIGHVSDFVFDDESWAIRYLVVDTRNWWPGGRKALIATQWIDRIDWDTKSVQVRLTRDQVKSSPEYSDKLPVDRAFEARLHAAYDRQGYWD